ncbi:nucleotidyl transferase AbiEii/AbiGii toxin family protein [PVC group bacterium]|nr:nucleotidyl transferase AbiEii/AbiGii toxin family protein [PVC group bacterium]
MDKFYADTVRLLLSVAPDVFRSNAFSLKGGTAINLFVRDMPRLSVDLDLVFTQRKPKREDALKKIAEEMEAIKQCLEKRNLTVKSISPTGFGDSKLIINDREIQIKIEVNHIFRGTVLPPIRRQLAAKVSSSFSVELEVPVLVVDELYGSKLVAAFDRQHPRDFFDVLQLYNIGGITDKMIECFVIYLAGHNRPTHEVLFANPKEITAEFENAFVGMTDTPVTLKEIESTRNRLFEELPHQLSSKHKKYLTGLTRAEPDWSLLQCPFADELPAIRWKLKNLKKFKSDNPTAFETQASKLEALLQ